MMELANRKLEKSLSSELLIFFIFIKATMNCEKGELALKYFRRKWRISSEQTGHALRNQKDASKPA